MGQQQLLLIVLGIIVVGIAVVISINIFRQSSVDQKRDLLVNESSSLSALALSYYKRAGSLGGGGNSFNGWNIPEQMKTTATGSFSAVIYSDSVVITGVGNEVVTGTDSVKIKTIVSGNGYHTIIIN